MAGHLIGLTFGVGAALTLDIIAFCYFNLERNLGHHRFHRVIVDDKAMMSTFSSISIICRGFPLVPGIANFLDFATGMENILAFYFLMASKTCLLMSLVFKLFVEPFKRFVIDRPGRQRAAGP